MAKFFVGAGIRNWIEAGGCVGGRRGLETLVAMLTFTQNGGETYGISIIEEWKAIASSSEKWFWCTLRMSPHGFGGGYRSVITEAKSLWSYFEVRKPIRQYLDKILTQAREQGFVGDGEATTNAWCKSRAIFSMNLSSAGSCDEYANSRHGWCEVSDDSAGRIGLRPSWCDFTGFMEIRFWWNANLKTSRELARLWKRKWKALTGIAD